MSADSPATPPRPWWWKLLTLVRTVWNSLAAAGVAPSQKNDPSDFTGRGSRQ